jgi:hypothetical protein
MVALPAVLESVNERRPPPLLVMVAMPAVLNPVKVVAPGVLLMIALPAVAVLSNCSSPKALMVGTFAELLRRPFPVNSRKLPLRPNGVGWCARVELEGVDRRAGGKRQRRRAGCAERRDT